MATSGNPASKGFKFIFSYSLRTMFYSTAYLYYRCVWTGLITVVIKMAKKQKCFSRVSKRFLNSNLFLDTLLNFSTWKFSIRYFNQTTRPSGIFTQVITGFFSLSLLLLVYDHTCAFGKILDLLVRNANFIINNIS